MPCQVQVECTRCDWTGDARDMGYGGRCPKCGSTATQAIEPVRYKSDQQRKHKGDHDERKQR